MRKIPLTKPYFSAREEDAAAEVVRSGWLVQGKKVKEFEDAITSYTGAKHAIATNCCTSALHMAFLLLGIGKGDEVICPSYTFVATANAIIYTGATPVFAEVDSQTYNILPSSIESVITERTKAIQPVHQFGLPANMGEIHTIAEKHNLIVVEDAAHGLGSSYKGTRVGNISPVSCFSFHPRKIITTGEGGMMTTSSDEIASRARMLRSHGAAINPTHNAEDALKESFDVLGYHHRMTDIQAAIGVEQMKKLDKIVYRRRALASMYDQLLMATPEILTPYVPEDTFYNYPCYTITVTDACKVSRNEIILEMAKRGISCRQGIPPIHTQPYYVALFGSTCLPVTEHVSKVTLLLPLYPTMEDRDPGYVVDNLHEVIGV